MKNLTALIENIFPKNFNKQLEDKKLLLQLRVLKSNLPPENQFVQSLFMGMELNDAAQNILSKSSITTREDVIKLAMEGTDSF